MEDKPTNGNGSKKNWLRESLGELTGKVGELTTKVEDVSDYCKNCDDRLKDLEKKEVLAEGIAIGKKAAYSGVDRRKEEKRNRLYVLIAIFTVLGSFFVYGINTFHGMEKSIENKIAHMIADSNKGGQDASKSSR